MTYRHTLVSCASIVRGRQPILTKNVRKDRTILGKFLGLPAITKELYAQKKVP